MARDLGAARAGGVAANWLAHRPHLRLSSDLRREGWPQYRFAYHDRQELGPVALSEMAKHTGLRPENL